MISLLSNKLARFIGNKLNANADEIEVYAYGAQIIIGALFKLTAIILLAWILDILPATLLLFVTFAAFRCFGGGAHLDSYARCLFFGITLIIGLGLLSKVQLNSIIVVFLMASAALAAIMIGLKWVPGDTEKKRIISEKIRSRQKRRYFYVLLFWGTAVVLLLMQSLNNFALAAVLGCFGSTFLITPIGYQFFTGIDNLFKKKGGECYDA